MLPFVAVTSATALFLQRVLRPKGGAVEHYLKAKPAGWLSRLRYVWYPGVVLAPLVLVGLALFGYLYTAAILASHLIRSLWIVLGAVIVHELALRWLSLADRRLDAAANESKAVTAIRDAADAGGGPAEGETRQRQADLSDSSLQTLRMFHFLIGLGLVAGLLVVWSDVLPALSILQQVVLWQHTATLAGKEVQQPFTLWSLAVMITLVAATVAVWRNLPGVIDVALLQRFRLSPASRYAIKQMTKYSIVTIGIVAIFKSVGGEWSQIQWLVAALGVGLGFGLQEIVANFISGIIILFEQPIRVGDVVTIGDLTGRVARIHIRATTITDFDNKDLIVPNKSFITGQLINWSLTSPITRLTIKVGIAYGSDTVHAHKIMLDTVRANPLVLTNPEPRVWFTGFGESSLDFTIYVFVQEMADRLPLTHDLHMAIEGALRSNGIEIPFPQRDVHIRSMPSPLRTEGGKNQDA
jgi:potassium efflux system protein